MSERVPTKIHVVDSDDSSHSRESASRAIAKRMLWLAKTLERFKSLWPAAIVVVLGLGHAVTGVFTTHYNLPPIPFNQVHYFVVGLPAFLLLGCCAAVAAEMLDMATRVHPIDWQKKPARVRLLLQGTVFLLVLTALASWKIYTAKDWYTGGMLICVVVAIGGVTLIRVGRVLEIGWAKALGKPLMVVGGVTLCVSFAVAVTGFCFAMAVLYLPQDYGGLKPKLARLDLVRAELSPENIARLSEPSTRQDIPVFQSRPVKVYYRTSDVVVVYPEGDSNGKELDLPVAAVRAYEWLNR